MGDDGEVVEGECNAQRGKTELYKRVVMSSVVYGSETWTLKGHRRGEKWKCPTE